MTLSEAHKRLKGATCPEDVFDGVKSVDDLKKTFREWAKVVHPDGKKGKALEQATEAFKLLNERHSDALSKLANGTYGQRLAFSETVTIKSKKREYSIYSALPGGAICSVYAATYNKAEAVVLKVPRSPANNDLLQNEQDMLHYLWEEARTNKLKAMCHIVEPVDSFTLAQGPVRKRVNVLVRKEGYYSLADIVKVYPTGLDIRDSAWMFNRLLGALLITSQAGVVHGAVLPEHFLVHPETHNGVLVDWCYSVRRGESLKVYVDSRKEYYPPEAAGGKMTPQSDLFMAAKVMLALTANPPHNITGLLKTCLLAPRTRPDDVYEFFKEFNAELKRAVGERKYRKFVMPPA